MLAYVKRTTVKLPDDLDARLRHQAKSRNITVSELTREAIETISDLARRDVGKCSPLPQVVASHTISRYGSRRSCVTR